MTIDSDSDSGAVTKKSIKKKVVIPNIEDEEIHINKEFQIDDIIDYGRNNSTKATQKFENKTLWSYKDSVKFDHNRGNAADE